MLGFCVRARYCEVSGIFVSIVTFAIIIVLIIINITVIISVIISSGNRRGCSSRSIVVVVVVIIVIYGQCTGGEGRGRIYSELEYAWARWLLDSYRTFRVPTLRKTCHLKGLVLPMFRKTCHLKGHQYTLSSMLVLARLPSFTTTTMGLLRFLFICFCFFFLFPNKNSEGHCFNTIFVYATI